MKKGLLGILAAGLMATAANAAELSLRFAGGGTEITMAPSDTATIEVVLHMNRAQDYISSSSFSFASGIDARFDVGSLVPGAGPQDPPAGTRPGWRNEFINDIGSSKYSVSGISSPMANWTTAASSDLGGDFNRSFFFAAGDPAGVSGLTAVGVGGLPAPAANAPTVIMSFTIHKDDFVEGDTFIAFRVESPLPALYNGSNQWASRFQFNNQLATNQYLMNSSPFATLAGNPGDADPRFPTRRGEEVLFPLIIHNVPEPGSLALLALGGLAILRRRN